MTITVDQSFIRGYGSGIDILSQQKVAKLLGLVRKENKVGEIVLFNRIGESSGMTEVTSRRDGATFSDENHSKRAVVSKLYTKKLSIDKIDEFKTDVNFRSVYQDSLSSDMGRKIDDIIIEAAFGTALTGKDGTGTQVLPSGQKVLKTFGATDGMTVEKMIEASRILNANEVDESEKRYMVLGSKALAQLMNENKIQSADYNAIKALVRGDIDTFMGFNIIKSERLGVDGSGDGRVLVFTEKALLVNMPKPIEVRIDENMDLNYLWQLQGFLNIGAVRMDDEKVVEIAFDLTV